MSNVERLLFTPTTGSNGSTPAAPFRNAKYRNASQTPLRARYVSRRTPAMQLGNQTAILALLRTVPMLVNLGRRQLNCAAHKKTPRLRGLISCKNRITVFAKP